MDEPLSNLDAKLRVHMRAEIGALHQRLGVTTIYVTHDQIEAMTMANRIVIMRDGEIQQIADPETMFERPANLFVAGFIGSPGMNILTGTAQAGTVNLFGQDVPVTSAANGPVTIGLRPEHLVAARVRKLCCPALAGRKPGLGEIHLLRSARSQQATTRHCPRG